MQISIKIEGLDALRKITKQNKKLLQKGFDSAVYYLFGKSQEIVSQHVVTGSLGASGNVTILDYFSATIEWKAKHASFLQEGTLPHQILPVHKKALKFKDSAGNIIFRKRVQHPGTSPVPYAWGYDGQEQDIEDALSLITKLLEKQWEEAK